MPAGSRNSFLTLLVGVSLLVLGGCEKKGDGSPAVADIQPSAAPPELQFVGAAACTACHQAQAQAWRGSHHDLAMAEASESTVLGDFDDTSFELAGVRSRFFRRDGGFFVNTEGSDGSLSDYRVSWTFGAVPLQQYLIEFPDGRIQALGIAWDTRPADDGGQRWFSVYGEQVIPAGDELHWTGPAQNWNYMCADCHSTGYRKNYDPATDRFASSWSDVDVACEACHGPGSQHLARAEAGTLAQGSGLAVSFSLPGRRRVLEPGASTMNILDGEAGQAQVEYCGRCHARRAPISARYHHGKPIMDAYLPALIEQPLYFADGQIRDEVYVYGSFRQSKMYAAGVVCTDCHDPHSLTLRAERDSVCALCHVPDIYAAMDHTRHADAAGAPGCVDCHMPSRNYMVVDGRRDHSFRVPRPDLAQSLGVTDACGACHGDRPAGWSASAVRQWLGRDAAGLQAFAQAFHAAGRGEVDAAGSLVLIASDAAQPAIVRASALAYLQNYPDPDHLRLAAGALGDNDPAVRLAALGLFAALPLAQRTDPILPLTSDPVRAVRMEAARLLVGADQASLSPAHRDALRAALADYVQAQQASLDRPAARLNLGNLYRDGRKPETAAQQYRSALALDPGFDPARVNLADLLVSQGDEVGAGELLRAGLEVRPDSALLQHSLGLHQVRSGNMPAAIASLARAVELAPDNTRFAYVYAVALDGQGRRPEALVLLRKVHEQRPADADVLWALVSFTLQSGELDAAREYALQLQTLRPGDPQLADLLRKLGNP